MHSCADRIIDIFSGQLSSAGATTSDGNPVPPQINKGENLLAEPAKFCYACKQAAREAAVGK